MRTIVISLVISVFVSIGHAGQRQADSAAGGTGPRLFLDYRDESIPANPVDCFMYFVPLTSPTSVAVETAPGTTFRASITSWDRKKKGDTVRVNCDFEVTGQGGYRASYLPDEMIRLSLDSKKDKMNIDELSKLLEWIELDGPCLGRIEGYGKAVGNDIRMESIEISFNRDNTESPVKVSIYDIPGRDGQFLYENRTNRQIARVNALKFTCTDDGSPRMSVEIASLKKAHKKEGLFSRLTAVIANILSTSAPVAPIGNTTMMDFGAALYEKQPVFSFPVAANIVSGV